jgi:glutathione S-transferase
MKLHHSAASPDSRRVRMFIAERGLDIPLVAVDLGSGEQHSEAYRDEPAHANLRRWHGRVAEGPSARA